MDAGRLRTNYAGPIHIVTRDAPTFLWRGKSKLYPRVRYELEFNSRARTFRLTKFVQMKFRGKAPGRPIANPNIVDTFRRCLEPEHVALITRLSVMKGVAHE
jgi:hypothetical protein